MEEISLDGLRPIVMSLEAARLCRIASKHACIRAETPWQRWRPEMVEAPAGKAMVWKAVQKSAPKNPDLQVSLVAEWEEQFGHLLAAVPPDGCDVPTLFRLLQSESEDVGDALVAGKRVSQEVWEQVRLLLQAGRGLGPKPAPVPDGEELHKLETKLTRAHKKELERIKSEKQRAEQEAITKTRLLQNRMATLEEKLRTEQGKGREQGEEIARLKSALVGEKQRVQTLQVELEQKAAQLQSAVRHATELADLRVVAESRTAEVARELEELTGQLAALHKRLEIETVRVPALVAAWASSYDWSSMQYVLEKTERELRDSVRASQTSPSAGLEEIWSTWAGAELTTIRTICDQTQVPTPSQVREHHSMLWQLESSLLIRIAVVRQIEELARRVEEYYTNAGGD